MISTEQRFIQYATGPVSFAIPFVIDAATEVHFTHVKTSDGARTVLIKDIDYTVNSPLDTITLVTPGNWAAGKFFLYGNDQFLQDVNLTEGGAFLAENVENGLDRVTKLIQQVLARAGVRDLTTGKMSQGVVAAPGGEELLDMTLPSVANRAGKLFGFAAVTGLPEPVLNIGTTVISQSIIADLLNPQHANETTVGLVALFKQHAIGYWERYIAFADGHAGGANVDTIVRNMFKLGHLGWKIDFGWGTTFKVNPGIELVQANANIPVLMVGYNVRFLAGNAGGIFFQVSNPHSQWKNPSFVGTFVFDSAGICSTALKVRGCQNGVFIGKFTGVSSVGGPNVWFETDVNAGIYYNILMGFSGGDETAEGSNQDGVKVTNVDGAHRMNANVLILPKGSWNQGYGINADRNNDTWIGPVAERNDLRGLKTDTCNVFTMVGGYFENNDLNMSGGGVSDGTGDLSLEWTANSNRVMVFGGRHVGNLVDYTLGSGHIYFPGQANGIQLSKTGMGFGGASASDNCINFLAGQDILFRAGGTTKWSWRQATDMMESAGKIHCIGELELDGILNHDGASVGLYNKAPVAQAGAITDPTGGATIDTQARAAVVSINAAIKAIGITA